MLFVPGAEAGSQERGLPRWGSRLTSDSGSPGLSLRTKALLAFGALVLYLSTVAVLVEQQRQQLRAVVTELTAVHRLDENLVQAHMAAAHAILGVHDSLLSPSREQALGGLLLDTDDVETRLAPLALGLLEGKVLQAQLGAAVANVRKSPSLEHLYTLRDALYRTASQLGEVRARVRTRETGLVQSYERSYDSITWMSLVLGMLGIAVFGALVTLFFARLVADIRGLELRAGEIVAGKRGPPSPVTRHDELGGLMQAINGMAGQLSQREQALELSRRTTVHHEKMAAVGSLAAGIAHEIGNPIAAISGVAQSICAARSAQHCPHELGCQPELILEQTRRIAAITREIADFAAPKPDEPQLTDLNALIRSSCSFVRYDRRYSHIDLELALDTQLPAAYVVADKLVQVLMNLLINAADAMDEVAERKPRVKVSTACVDGVVRLEVQDNGCGMDAGVKQRAFEPFFTTKAAGKGTGLGLPLCRSLVEGMGGSVAFESEAGQGTRVELRLPLAASEVGAG